MEIVPSWFLSNISKAALKAANSSGRSLSAMIEEVQQAVGAALPATQKSIMHCCQAYRKPRLRPGEGLEVDEGERGCI